MIADKKNKCPGCKRTDCGGCGIYRKLNTNKQVRIQFPPDFRAEPAQGLGISFDVGTTTLAGMLWDLGNASLLDAETGTNPQAVFGTDVISRLQAAAKEENRGKMRKMLTDKLDEMAFQMVKPFVRMDRAEEEKAIWTDVKKVVIVGNTAMCEILLGIEPKGLLKAPFTPDYKQIRQRKGKLFGFSFLQNADIIVLPPIGGYVGADALAVYHYVNSCEKGKILAVDIGTNGEILLLNGSRKFACSAAAGPALEGGAVCCGMRAVKGAIDMVSLNGRFPMEDIVCRVIGEAEPLGICGSGLMDALAILLQTGVLDSNGYMKNSREAKTSGVPPRIIRRIEEKGERRFLLTDEKHPVYLTAGDVRQLQLSVSAIRSGIEVLLKKAGLGASELNRIYLAGAFGCYIDIESSIKTGLFPKLPAEKILQAGNLAGTGAAMALLSSHALLKMEKEALNIVHVELAEDEEFKELFLYYMNFVN